MLCCMSVNSAHYYINEYILAVYFITCSASGKLTILMTEERYYGEHEHERATDGWSERPLKYIQCRVLPRSMNFEPKCILRSISIMFDFNANNVLVHSYTSAAIYLNVQSFDKRSHYLPISMTKL